MQNLTIHLQPTPELIDSFRAVVRSELANYTPPAPVGTDLPEYLTRRQTAETLQVSLTSLWDWAKDTEDRGAILVPLKINGRVRYRRADVLAALKESRRFKSTAKADEGRGV